MEIKNTTIKIFLKKPISKVVRKPGFIFLDPSNAFKMKLADLLFGPQK